MIEYQISPFKLLTNTTLYDILALREEVFTLEQKCTEPDIDQLDKQAIHIFGTLENKIVAVARILPPETNSNENSVHFGRIAIKKDKRSNGYGKAIMKVILKYIQENFPDSSIECSAQKYLQKFYESYGFQKIGKAYKEGGISHIKMTYQKI